uniref:Piwi domain-containing protein n=1 Tax=Ascaris lumbricoides TaxID=6252 RepID=A0A9J2PLL4_ASCLU
MPFGRGRGKKQNTKMNNTGRDIGDCQLRQVNSVSQSHRQGPSHSASNNGSTECHSAEEIRNQNVRFQGSPSEAVSTSTKLSNEQQHVISYGRGKARRKEFPKQAGTRLNEAEVQPSQDSPVGTNDLSCASVASGCTGKAAEPNKSRGSSSKQPELGCTQNLLGASTGEHEAKTPSQSSGSHYEETTSSSRNNVGEPNMVPHAANVSVMAPKLPPAKVQQSVTVTTNIFPLVVEDRLVYRYDVRVEAEPLATGGRIIDLCRGSDPDRQRKCMLLLRLALEQYRRAREMAYVYDLSTTLFTNRPLDLKEVSRISIEPSDLTDELSKMLGGNVRVRISINECVEYAHTFRLSDFTSSVTNDLNAQDRSLRQFLELLTTQSAHEAGTHYSFGSGRLFLKDGRQVGMPEKDLGDGRRLVSGVDKGVRFIGGEGASIVPALVLDSKKAPFFDDISLLDLAAEIWTGRKACPIPVLKAAEFQKFFRYVGRSLSDLMVRRSSSEKPFRISYLSKIPIRDIRTPVSKKLVRLSEQYKSMNIKIRLDLPAVVLALRNTKLYLPMEVLTVVSGQRVPLYKQTARQTKETIKLSVVKPDIRFRDILRHMEALNLHEGGRRNDFLAAFGVKVSREPLKVEANRRTLPKITFGQEFTASADQKMANWKSGEYLSPARIKQFYVLFDDENDEDNVKSFVNALRGIANSKGMVLENEPQIERVPFVKLEAYFQRLSSDPNNPTFIMYIDEREQSHDDLKLYEALYQVITQHIKANTMREAPDRPQTLENIVNKMNAKNFGQNYQIVPEAFAKNKWIGRGETLVIGYDVCHPESQATHQRRMGLPHDEPSVIGFSFNGARNPETFIGDYAYHEPRKEQVTNSILEERAYRMVKLFTEHRGSLPKLVIITRDGVSEGQIKMVVEEELDAIKVGIRNYIEHSQKPTAREPKYVVVIATKRHNKRFFEMRNGQMTNTQPGTVVDHTVTRADVTEVFMQSHRVIQGTGKLPAYTMPVNEANMTMEELQSMMMALCYEHQIVNAAISIPEPIFQADEWAKRGRNNFRAFRRRENNLPRNGESVDWNRITDELCYMNKALEKTRSNA